MKVFQAVAPRKGEFTELPVPEPGPRQVLVKVAYCGICGTDYDLFSGESGFIKSGQATYPIRLGHEWSGVVAKVGSDVTKLKEGDRVAGDNFVSCGVCDRCLKGDFDHCYERHHVGTINPCWPGAFAEYYLVPEHHVYKVADSVSLMEAALCEPMSVAYGGVKKMDINADSVVAVIGTGSIGMAAAALAAYKGGKVYVVGRNARKLELAKNLDIAGTVNSAEGDVAEQLKELTGGRLADYVLECSGNGSAVNDVITLAAQNATAAMIGFYNAESVPVDVNLFVAKEIRMYGIMGEYGNLEACAGILSEADLHLDKIITGIVPFEALHEALLPKDTKGLIKTIVKIGEFES